MRSEPVVVGGPDIRIVGASSLVQGVYGARGNLELVACDADDGLWVFWCNADRDTDPPETPDVPPGAWSAGLRFARGIRYRDAQILQSTLGPDHLEVLALDDGGALQSWYWSPGPGFRRRVPDAAAGVIGFAAEHDRGTVRVTTTDAAGAVRHLVSPPDDYPARTWQPATEGPASDRDALDEVIAAGVAAEEVVPGTARRTVSTRDGGTVELTWRDARGIRHLGVPV